MTESDNKPHPHPLGGEVHPCTACGGEYRLYVDTGGAVRFEHERPDTCPMMVHAMQFGMVSP